MAELERLIDAEQVRGQDSGTGVAHDLHRLCLVLMRLLSASQAGVTVWGPGGTGGVIAGHAGVGSRELEEMQFTFGEGPCIEAWSSRHVVLEPDLNGRGSRRWPGYGPAASGRGVRSVFAFPLGSGSACIGSLDVYRTDAGPLSPLALQQGFWFTEIALQMILLGQSQAGPERLAPVLDDALSHRLEVYQAQGMVMIDLGVSLAEAMLRLRAYAFAVDRPITDVSKDIVAGRLTLDRDVHRRQKGTDETAGTENGIEGTDGTEGTVNHDE
ncbi:ANTAR domain-containing protein [Humibacillus xanthopallidus]|uniref:GAF and ANTAR domain-containing protein n=1 Tax=Humibacillus xanthopallidus TaxID=412689 RepID=UPI00384E5E2A